jgi:hypothetical protein
VNASGRVRVGADGERQHDDLVMALALACWSAKGREYVREETRRLLLRARVGRRWRSEAAGVKVAAILSVVESCRRLGLPVNSIWPKCCQVSTANCGAKSDRLLRLVGPPADPEPYRVALTDTL